MIRLRSRPLAHRAQVATLVALLTDDAGDRAPLHPADPSALVAAATDHRVVGHLAAAVRDARVVLSPAAARELESVHLALTLHAQLLRRELAPVVAALTAACATAPVLLKGPAVTDRFYTDPGRRPFSDLDLLVPRGGLGAAVAALETLGYTRGPQPWPGYGERHGHEIALTRPVGARRLCVELHWRVSDDAAAETLDHATLSADDAPLMLRSPGGSAVVASRPLQLLVLAVHLLHEPVQRLGWLHDLKVVGTALDGEEWREAFATAERLGLSWVLHRALDHVDARLSFGRPRPAAAGPPPPWGALRAGELLGGWLGFQAGRAGVGGVHRRDGYLRSALAAHARSLRRSFLDRRRGAH